MHDERIDPSMYYSTEGLVHSSQALSRVNKNFRLRVRFRFRPGTRTAYKIMTRVYVVVDHIFFPVHGLFSMAIAFPEAQWGRPVQG